ncbi:hypothetical protein BKH46_08305 [Helicobacter sp. 12S02634-8]|uniref:toprim domain-containing protein n=1 Tax=Helicobacter sp. 12S02634-8 TaxID=1476199 RepID=UPI000BA63789|nr:toprim domain-containing protein [Helicobacter sp. 12S02634-8]PAF46232.1 hypothetical protein BKH46_08305 [Helicobacter sp. 12S02634-8]
MKTDRESMAYALTLLGYQVKAWKLRLREEKTPSAFINKDGFIHDFGSGFHGDLADVLCQYHNFSKGEALKKARELLSLPIQADFLEQFEEKKEESRKNGFIDESYLAPFIANRKTHFEEYTRYLKALLPSVTSPQKRKEIALKYEIGFSPKGTFRGKDFPARLLMPLRDEEGRIVTFWKYNPFSSGAKLLYSEGRRKCAFNITDLIEYRNKPNEIVYICEGEKDVLNAVAYGLRAVTSGSAADLFEDSQIHLFEGLRVVVLGDNDESGQNFNNKIEQQLKPVAKHIRKLSWKEFLKSKGEDFIPPKGFDLTDWLTIKIQKD